MSSEDQATELEREILSARGASSGSDNIRSYVGPAEQYDFMGATQFALLTRLGLREEHHVVDIGCGSLRAGRYLIQYLFPRRYTGIDPNAWLWKTAIDKEIGTDLIALKQPRLLDEADFRMTAVESGKTDFAVAQSIYSHTGEDLFRTSVAAVARCLSPTGQFLFTVITPEEEFSHKRPDGMETTGWVYPGCVKLAPRDVEAVCAEAGLHAQRLHWFHPRQTWFRATPDPARLLSDCMMVQLGTGKPLFDDRFD